MKMMTIAIIIAVTQALVAAQANPQVAAPFETATVTVSHNKIDELVVASLQEHNIQPSKRCSDEVFVRRAYLDLIGTLPESEMVKRFLEDSSSDKRAALVDYLMEQDSFADYWAMKWCDVLRVKAEFPINLWPNAVQAYHKWIHDAIRDNMPFDQFARALLTSSGSNFRVPPVNFYRAIQGRDPGAIADAVALTFMGERADKWPENRRAGMAAFFSRIAYKGTAEWKEEIVCLNPAPGDAVKATFPDGTAVAIASDTDPRIVFADWLIRDGNPWFARNVVNRAWAWMMGRGIIHEPDDIRADNPASNPELLAYLEKEFVRSGYDLRQVLRLIANSATYQQSSIQRNDDPRAEALFAYYPVRRLDAELLLDAMNQITGASESYSSAIPEPFTYIDGQRSITLADGSITSSFLEMFGRPPRDSGLASERNNQPSDAQRLYLLNSSEVQRRIARSSTLAKVLSGAKGNRREAMSAIYLTVLSRYPTDAELAAAQDYLKTSGVTPKQAAEDIVWALINSKEFLYRH